MFSLNKSSLVLSLAPLIMLALALAAQFGWGWEPCTMCVEVRFLLCACSVVGLASLILPGKLSLLLWAPATLLAAAAAFLNAKLVLLEHGIINAFSCSPFPFYSQAFPLQDWIPAVFMSGGICGQNDHLVLGVSFTTWTLMGVSTWAMAHLGNLYRLARA